MKKPVIIMSLVWYKVLPAHFGGQKGIANFNEALGNHFPLYCVCSKNNEPGNQHSYQVFNWLPVSKSQIINPVVWYKIFRFAREKKVSHVILEHPYHAITGWLLQLFLSCFIITHSHNIEFARFKQLGKWYWRLVKVLEGFAYQLSEEILFKTKHDLEVAIKDFDLAKSKCFLMPYGTTKKDTHARMDKNLSIRQKHGLADDAIILLFNGTLDYGPNAKAVNNIAVNLLPLLPPNHVILITGRSEEANLPETSSLINDRMILAGYVPEVSDYFLAADVYINPVAEGGGVQTKNIEALSYGLNIVCWQHMLNGLEIELTGSKVYLAKTNDWKDFLARILVATIVHAPTPDTFFEHYNFDKQVLLLKERIQKNEDDTSQLITAKY